MSDRKTAAELRELARLHGDNWLYLHLAAVEEERERDVETVPDAVHEGGWQWRPTSPSTAFAPPLGTIRACDACGALVAGGPTRCIHCVRGVEDEREDKDAPVERDLRAMTALSEEIRSALNAGPEESTVGAAKRVVQERDSLVGKWKEVDDLTRSRDDWKARHDQVFAEADVKIDELHMKLAKARADLDDAALHETRMNATLEKTAHDAHTAIARAEAAEKALATAEHWRERHCKDAAALGEQSQTNWARAEAAEKQLAECDAQLIAAEKRVAELEGRLAVPGADELTRLREERDHYREQAGHNIVDAARYAAGIREGLERAAAWCEESRAAGKLAKGLRAMKRRVK